MSPVLNKNSFDAALVPGVRELMSSDYVNLRVAEKKMMERFIDAHGDLPGSLSNERNCVMCGAARSRAALRYRTYGLRIVTCGECGMTYSCNIIDETADRARYLTSGVPQLHQAIRANAAYADLEAKKAAYLAGRLSSTVVEAGRLLDVGCSTGVLLDAARDFGWVVHGVEANRELAESARRKGLDVTVGFFPDALPSGFKADAISLLDVLEHAADPIQLLLSVRSHLNPRGRVLVQVPNFNSLIIRLEGASNSNLCIGHWSYFTPETLDKMLAKVGFQSIYSETIISEIDKIRTFEWSDVLATMQEIGVPPLQRPEELTVERLHALGMGYKATGVYELVA